MESNNTRTVEEIMVEHNFFGNEEMVLVVKSMMEQYASQFKAAPSTQGQGEEYVLRRFDTNNYYWCKCENCGWEDSSEHSAGGHSIGDTGDYGEVVCPICCSDKIEGETNTKLPEEYGGTHFVKIPLDTFLAPYQKAAKRAFELEDEKHWNTVMMNESTPPSHQEQGERWITEKPEADHEFTLVTKTKCLAGTGQNYNYQVWNVIKFEDSEGWYYALCNGEGEEWGPYEDLSAQFYKII